MTKEEQLDLAINAASNFHRGQTDRNGMPYILHPLAVMQNVHLFVPSGIQDLMSIQIVAVLHDIIEDTSMTPQLLVSLEFDASVVEAVCALTRQSEETYTQYIQRVAQNDIATIVKLADINHNLRPGCPDSLRERYKDAQKYLLAVLSQKYPDVSRPSKSVYIITNHDTDYSRAIAMSPEQRKAIDWFIDFADLNYTCDEPTSCFDEI